MYINMYVSMYDFMKKYTFSVSPQIVVPATLFQTDSRTRPSRIGCLLIIWAQKMTAKVRIMHSHLHKNKQKTSIPTVVFNSIIVMV